MKSNKLLTILMVSEILIFVILLGVQYFRYTTILESEKIVASDTARASALANWQKQVWEAISAKQLEAGKIGVEVDVSNERREADFAYAEVEKVLSENGTSDELEMIRDLKQTVDRRFKSQDAFYASTRIENGAAIIDEQLRQETTSSQNEMQNKFQSVKLNDTARILDSQVRRIALGKKYVYLNVTTMLLSALLCIIAIILVAGELRRAQMIISKAQNGILHRTSGDIEYVPVKDIQDLMEKMKK